MEEEILNPNGENKLGNSKLDTAIARYWSKALDIFGNLVQAQKFRGERLLNLMDAKSHIFESID
eukprot:3576922-Lingulodinium_polyedra.AAC.1